MHSTPGMPGTNGIADSKVELVLHGARFALRQAGLEAKFWPYACRLPFFGSVLVFGSCRFLVLLGSSLNLVLVFRFHGLGLRFSTHYTLKVSGLPLVAFCFRV